MNYYPEFERQLKERNITRRQISELLGISPYGLYKKLQGTSPIALAEAIAIRDAYFPDENVEDLFHTN